MLDVELSKVCPIRMLDGPVEEGIGARYFL